MTRTFSTMMTSAVVLGSLMAGCSGGDQNRPKLTVNDNHSLAPKIERMLADKNYVDALGAAEQFVALDPHNGDARAMLGRTYLANGRYVSARTAFSDAVTLGNRDPRTIISLSLAESALGNVEGARALLASHIADLPAGDYGLAMAMAGDAREGVRALIEAANAPDATVKTRQNLAYALAMAGAWGQARLIVGQDLSSREAEARIGEWTRTFAQGSPSDRVVAMLGVSPRTDDSGLPVQLALNRSAEQPVQLANAADLIEEAASVSEAAPVAVVAAPVVEAAPAAKPVFGTEALAAILARAPTATAPKGEIPLEVAELPTGAKAAPEPVPAVQQASSAPMERLKVAFTAIEKPAPRFTAPRLTAPAPLAQAAPKPAAFQPKAASQTNWTAGLGKPATTAKASNWVVQIGAFNSDTVARAQWQRLTSDRATLRDYSAVHSVLALKGKTFYRLAIRGFEDRGAAATACGVLKTSGQDCFVRLDDKGAARQASGEHGSSRTRASS